MFMTMAGMMSDIQLASQPKSTAVHWPVPIYTIWYQRHMTVNYLPNRCPIAANCLPQSVQSAKTISDFKHKLNVHYFELHLC